MSLTDARREVSAMRASFSDALVEAAESCTKIAEVLIRAACSEICAEDASRAMNVLIGLLSATRDATMTWAAMDTLMREIER